MAVPGVLSTRQPTASPNPQAPVQIQVSADWFQHPKVRLAYQRSDGSALGTLEELQALLEGTERVCEELGRRGGHLAITEVLERVEAIAADQKHGADSLNEIRDLLKNGFTQAELNRMFGWKPDHVVVRKVAQGLRPARPTDEQIVATYQTGLGVIDTAKALRIDTSVVSSVVRASGVPRHKPIKKSCRPAVILPPAA